MKTMTELLEVEERNLLFIERRWYALHAFEAELTRVTEGRAFRIWNDIVWMMVLDQRDQFFVHFASWAKSVCNSGGLLKQIQGVHVSALSISRRALGEKRGEKKRSTQARREAFASLFPDGATRSATTPSGGDVASLSERFRLKVKALLDDRSTNRAHPYEVAERERAPMLDLVQARALLDHAEQLLNDLRLVADGSWLDYHDTNQAGVESVAADLVDAVLCGPSSRKDLLWGTADAIRKGDVEYVWQLRERYYERERLRNASSDVMLDATEK